MNSSNDLTMYLWSKNAVGSIEYLFHVPNLAFTSIPEPFFPPEGQGQLSKQAIVIQLRTREYNFRWACYGRVPGLVSLMEAFGL